MQSVFNVARERNERTCTCNTSSFEKEGKFSFLHSTTGDLIDLSIAPARNAALEKGENDNGNFASAQTDDLAARR